MNNVQHLKEVILVLIMAWLLCGCAEEQIASTHPDEWAEPTSANSHIAKIVESGIAGCQACHGGNDTNNYFGGTSGVSCYQCHEGGPSGHPAWSVWMTDTDSTNDQFHGKAALISGTTSCNDCHSANAQIGITGHTCTNCH